MAEYSQKWHNGTSRTRSTKTSDGLTVIQAQLNNLGREIKKEKDLGSFTIPCYINNVCFENALDDFRSSQYAVSAQQNSKLMFKSRQTNIPFPSRLNDCYCNEKNGLYGMQCFDAYSFGATRVDDSLPRKEKDPGSFILPCYINNVCFENAFTDLGASIAKEEDFTKYIRDKIVDVKASLTRVRTSIHEMESKSDKVAWKDAIDCFKETKDRLELKLSRLT
nr:hypothetical protein [Tanacetum cinerariifolium]